MDDLVFLEGVVSTKDELAHGRGSFWREEFGEDGDSVFECNVDCLLRCACERIEDEFIRVQGGDVGPIPVSKVVGLPRVTLVVGPIEGVHELVVYVWQAIYLDKLFKGQRCFKASNLVSHVDSNPQKVIMKLNNSRNDNIAVSPFVSIGLTKCGV